MKKQTQFPGKEKEIPFNLYTAIHIGVVIKAVPDEDASFIYMEGSTPYGDFANIQNISIDDKDLIKCYHGRMTSHYFHGGPYQPLMKGTWVVVAYASDINLGIILCTMPDRNRNILPKGQKPEEGKDDALGMLYHHHSGVWTWIHRNGDIEIAHPSETGEKWSFVKIGKTKTLSKRFRQIVEDSTKIVKTVSYKLGVAKEDIKPLGKPYMGFFHWSGAEIYIDPEGNITIKSALNKKVFINPDTPPDGGVCGSCPSLKRSLDVLVNGRPAVVEG